VTKKGIPARIKAFNEGRDPEGLQRKYEGMAKNRLAFLRGTCHLFWEDWPDGTTLDRAPLAWNTGDLHLENFGAFKGDNGLDYFDINDFDEAGLVPCIRDVVRCACSVFVEADDRKLSSQASRKLCDAFCDGYVTCLQAGRIGWIERELAVGEVGKLLKRVRNRTREAFLQEHTEVARSGRRRIRIDGVHMLPASEEEREFAAKLVGLAAQGSERSAFRVLDVTRQFVGTGSLGLERYAVLVKGKGSRKGNRLLVLKRAHGSAMGSGKPLPVPWESEAERVVWAQRFMQAASPLLLRVRAEEHSYTLRELQPQEDKLQIKNLEESGLESAVQDMGRLLAWAQLRASGRRGAAGADALMEYAEDSGWRPHLIDYARSYASKVHDDFRDFKKAKKDGNFDAPVASAASHHTTSRSSVKKMRRRGLSA
jgi:uncharacterized protein (DUF2252 family)